MSGLFVPSSTLPIASMARLSIWPFSANFEKSWMKARWIMPSASFAALFRLSRSQSAAMNLGAHLLERFGVGIGTREAHNLMAVGDQFFGRGGADKPGCAGDEYTHGDNSFLAVENQLASRDAAFDLEDLPCHVGVAHSR